MAPDDEEPEDEEDESGETERSLIPDPLAISIEERRRRAKPKD